MDHYPGPLSEELRRWDNEIVAHHRTGASNGPTEAIKLGVKNTKRTGRGFRNFDNYGSAAFSPSA